MTETSALEKVLRHDRLIVAVGLAGVVALAWAYLVAGAGIDMSMAGMPMEPMPWSTFYAALVFTMWWVMMIAMMMPSATPLVLLFAAIKRKQGASVSPSVEAWAFLSGYLVIWAGFSLIAALAQWGLERAGLLSMAMASTSAALGGVLLLAAGLYQFTPVKNASLLPEPGAVPEPALATGRDGSIVHGAPARRLLPRLLLVPDGAAVRQRDHEPCLDCRHQFAKFHKNRKRRCSYGKFS